MQSKNSLEIGGLYCIREQHVINVYDSTDVMRHFYEKYTLLGGTVFVILEKNFDFDFGTASQGSMLILSKKGLGRLPMSDDFYNDWRYEKLADSY